MMTTPNRQVVITCSADTAVVCPGLPSYPAAGVTYYYLFKHCAGLRAAVAGR